MNADAVALASSWETAYPSLQDFVMGLSVLSRGSTTEKLRWAYSLYDINKDGAVTKEEVFEIISSVYSLLGHYSAPMADDAREHASRVFQVTINPTPRYIKQTKT